MQEQRLCTAKTKKNHKKKWDVWSLVNINYLTIQKEEEEKMEGK